MEITRFIVNPFQVNAIVIVNNNECILIDAAVHSDSEYKMLTDYIDSKKVVPKAIFNTHGHIDHICGNKRLMQKYDMPLYMHKADSFLLDSATMHASIFGMELEKPPMFDYELKDGMNFDIGGEFINLIHVPGHSPGSMAFYYEKDAFVITGDALFAGSIGRTDLPQGSFDELVKSIKEKLFVLPPHTAIFPGHGPDSSIGTESRENPYVGIIG